MIAEMEVLVDRYRVFFGILSVVVWASTLASLVVLHRLRKHRPEKLAQVGIQHIDWWFACWRGIGRLAFSTHGDDLTMRERLALQVMTVSCAVFLVSMPLLRVVDQLRALAYAE